MIINKELLDGLSAQAKESPRLRMHCDLRNTPDDKSQRILNAMEPEMLMPIHRHRNTSETVIMLRGKAKWLYYDEQGNVTDTFILEAGSPLCGVNVPKGQWHNTVCLEHDTVIFEAKDGVYEPLSSGDILTI